MKKFVPLALLLGLLAAMVGGASTASATGRYSCSNGVANLVTCNTAIVGPVIVKITGNRALTAGELSVLENNLNNTSVDVTALKNVTVDTYKSFNPPINITLNDINVCIASVCS
ncbi:hypothetical protein ACIGW8_26730 [Streptomyces sioyaensis]|uniref:hypothetical protein n=1 Tax=Streptomyces sioyaensis TaxID=67364 RepID=UPI0037D6618B